MSFASENLLPTAELTVLEKALLFSADESGFIPMPEGNYSEICLYIDAFAHLQQRRHVCRRPWNGCQAFCLTKSGENLKFRLLAPGMQAARRSLKRPARHRKLLPFVLGLLLAGAIPLQARLGESPGRIEARYGAPVKIDNGIRTRDFQCTYKHSGIVIVVRFLDEKSQCESYASETGGPLTDAEIQRLLEVNCRGGHWKRETEQGSSKKWDLNSGEASAAYRSGDDQSHPNELEITTSWWDHYVTGHPMESTDGVGERLKDF